MAGACRLGDQCSGHGPYPPRPCIEASTDVIINGMGANRLGDAWLIHTAPNLPPHPGFTSGGSGSVFINGQPAARIGDPISCGSTIAQGSTDVIIGG